MRLDDRFDDLVVSLGGFYRTWFVYVGLELGLLARLREAKEAGLTADELAAATGTEPDMVAAGPGAPKRTTSSGSRTAAGFPWRPRGLLNAVVEYLGGQYLLAAPQPGFERCSTCSGPAGRSPSDRIATAPRWSG